MTAGKGTFDIPPRDQGRQPGIEAQMMPKPICDVPSRIGSGRLAGTVAIITGGDSGIGRAVAIEFARDGARIAIVYLDEHEDARKTEGLVEEKGSRALLCAGDVGDESFCRQCVQGTVDEFGALDVLVNNAAEQHAVADLVELTEAQLVRTFRTNIFSYFFMAKAALPHLPLGGTIINTTSVTAYGGHPELVDYAATKGAIVAFTRSLALMLADRGIRVNGVAPGPIWTPLPLIPASFDPEKASGFGKSVPMGRAGQPYEVSPCYVFLASDDSSYMSGQVLHPNGGTIVNG